MRILVISDTHGHERILSDIIKKAGKIDCAIHLGDSDSSADLVREMFDCPVYMVAGNCDYFTDIPDEAALSLAGHRIFITHGHRYYVSHSLKELKRAALKRKCDLALFGHTHCPIVDESDPRIILANPGSACFPRQTPRRKSYMILELNEGEKPVFEQRFAED